jgi:hypothetical protein
MKKSTPRTDRELWHAIKGHEDDLPDPHVPMELVDQELRALGADPDALAREGETFARGLLEQRRLRWQENARQKRDSLASRVLSATRSFAEMNFDELLAEFLRVRAEPGFGEALAGAFHNRKPEESSPEELRAILEDFDKVRAMRGPQGGR